MEGAIPVVSPVPLNTGEHKLVEDLRSYWISKGSEHLDTELYVMRNLTRGRGVGFFEAGNFYPDFIVWLVRKGRQDIIFVDPKGLFHVAANDPKVQFHETIKELEARLPAPDGEVVRLHSYIVSRTRSNTVVEMWGLSKLEIESRNVLFLEDPDYVQKIMSDILVGD